MGPSLTGEEGVVPNGTQEEGSGERRVKRERNAPQSRRPPRRCLRKGTIFPKDALLSGDRLRDLDDEGTTVGKPCPFQAEPPGFSLRFMASSLRSLCSPL